MKVECFTAAKDPNDPARNEDRCIVIPGRAYAVIDGVSDKTGLTFDGLTGGQMAGALIEAAIREACRDGAPDRIDVRDLCRDLEARFHSALEACGATSVPANIRMGAQLVLALEGRDRFRFIVIGDSGLRLNGREVFSAHHEIDDICAAIRKVVWRHLSAGGLSRLARDAGARAHTVAGLSEPLPEWSVHINGADIARLRAAAFAELRPVLPHLDDATIDQALRGGLREQSLYINRIHPLGFPAINGFPIPAEYLLQFERDKAEIDTLELFSDGYFGCADRPEIAAWEERIRWIEDTDPDKIGAFPSTKGSRDGRFTDDRTILILRSPWS